MNRRELFAAGVGLGIAALTWDARAGKPDARGPLLDAVHNCIAKGELCQAHCQTELASGNKEFAHCNAAVTDMLEVCRATASLISRQSPHIRDQLLACVAVCKECAAACAEHKAHFAHGMHLECKACMEACDTLVQTAAAFT